MQLKQRLALEVEAGHPSLQAGLRRSYHDYDASEVPAEYGRCTPPSLTDARHCYRIAIAERIKPILEDEFFLDAVFLACGAISRRSGDRRRQPQTPTPEPRHANSGASVLPRCVDRQRRAIGGDKLGIRRSAYSP